MYAITLFAFLTAIVGYGTLVQRALHGEARDLAYSAALGVAALIVMGGILNALGLAYGPAIDIVLFGGTAIALALFARLMVSAEGRAQVADAGRRALRWPAAWLVVVCFAFTAFFFAPTSSYNPHDDMAQYLTRPYVMMTFGSIGANWFDSTGADSLGVQSWLQAFFLRYLPLGYANAVDAAVMLSLTCAMLASFGARLGAPSWLAMAAVLLFMLLNPSQVNVSAVYSLTLMVAGLAMALLRTVETYLAGAGERRHWLIGLVPAGIFLAALPALKATSAVWGLLFAVSFVFVALSVFRTRRDALAAVAVVGVSGAATVVLWAAAFLPLYLAGLVAAEQWPRQPTAPPPYCTHLYDCWGYAWGAVRFFNWFSTEPVQYGQIGLVATLCWVITLIAVLQSLCSRGRAKHRLSFAAIGIATLLFFLVGPALFPWGYLRYSAPVVFVTVCLAILFAGATAATAANRGGLPLRPSWRWGAALLVPTVAIAVLVAPDFKERVEFAVGQRTSTQLARLADFHAGASRLVSPEHHDRIRALQERIPPGSSILAAIITPTHLDFERNPVFPHFQAALSTPWWGDISATTPAQLRRILADRGIDYVIWQHGGAWTYSEQDVVDQTTTRAWVISTAARNSLQLLRAVKGQKLGPTVYRDAEYTISQVVPDYDGEPLSDYFAVLGKPINFAAGADYAPHLLAGWSFRESVGVWSDGPVATLRFDLERHPQQPLRLAAALSAFTLGRGGAPLAVTVEANGHRIATWKIDGTPSTRCATIPVAAVPGRTVSISFNIDDPKSPDELGIAPDTRRLGILLRRAGLSVAADADEPCSLGDEYVVSLGKPINFAAGADYAAQLFAGWSFREAAGVWSDAPVATLRFDLERPSEQPLRLEAELSAFTVGRGGAPLAVAVEANGQRIATWKVADTPAPYCATIPTAAMPGRTVSITFDMDNPKSPAELGISADTRRLGIMLKKAGLSIAGESDPGCTLDR